MAKKYGERVENLTKKIEQLQNQRKTLIQRQKIQDRKDRAHRLIQIAAELESAAGCEIDPKVLAAYLQTTVRRNADGTEVTVIEIQKQYYERTKQRLQGEQEEERKTDPDGRSAAATEQQSSGVSAGTEFH